MLGHHKDYSPTERKTRFSFFALTMIFLLLLLVSPLLPNKYESVFVNITFSFLIIAAALTLSLQGSLYFAAFIAVLLTIFLNTLKLFQDTFWAEFTSNISSLILIGCITVVLFNRVFFSKSFKVDLIFGSICVYILLGTLWALCYSLVELIHPFSFEGIDPLITDITVKEHPFRLQPFLYFSFVTQTTLGYGDVTPSAPFTHSLAIVQAIMGQFYVAVLVAGLVGILVREKY